MSKYYDGFMRLFNLYKLQEIADALELKGYERVLDIGGGTGRLAEVLKKKSEIVYILDESKEMLSRIKQEDDVVPIVGDALDICFENNSIGVAILSDVLHHIRDQYRLLEEINRILKNDGKLLIMDFDKRHIKTKLLKLFERLLFGRLYFKSYEEVIRLIEDKFFIKKAVHKGYYFIIVGEKKC